MMTPIISLALLFSSVKVNIPSRESLGRTFNASLIRKVRVRPQHFIRFSNSFWSGELGESRYENELDALSFLPINSFNGLHPETLRVLKKLSRVFVESSIKPDIKIDIKEFLDMLDSVYKVYPSREVTINNQTIELEEVREILSIVLGFCALLRIPKEITTMLLEGVLTIPEMHKASKYVDIFKEKGWPCIEFKKGLPIRLKRKSRWSQLTPRNIISRSSKDIEYASIAVWEANKTSTPPKLMRRQDLEAELNEIGGRLANTDIQIEEIKFFPHQSLALKLIRRVSRKVERFQMTLKEIVRTQSDQLKKMGNAGLLSYTLLQFLFLSASALWSWKELTPYTSHTLVTYDMNTTMLIMKKCLKIFLVLFVGSKLTQIPRLYLSNLIATFVKRTLLFFERQISKRAKDRAILISRVSVLFLLVAVSYQLLIRGLG